MAQRILAILTALALVSTFWVGTAEAVSGTSIARIARSYVGDSRWTRASSSTGAGANTNKCNIFVAHVLEEAGATVPHRRWGLAGPIGAGEWGNPYSSYLTSAQCWENYSNPRVGDVIGDRVHVGIVTGPSESTSAPLARPIVSNDFGFRTNSHVTFWRYTC